MVRFMAAAALLAVAIPAFAAETPHAIEDDYAFWQSVRIDSERGVAVFVTPAHRTGDAISFEMLLVYRDEHSSGYVGMAGVRFDKEIFKFLGDCGEGTVLQMGYRYQRANEPVNATVSPVPMPERPFKGSDKEAAFTEACRASQGKGGWQWPAESIKDPYGWAKQRLGKTRP